jgi:hypothetical protein
MQNCGFGTGTMVNASGNVNNPRGIIETGHVDYASGVTPWNAPDSGDFSIVLGAAKYAGRGVFGTGLTSTSTNLDIGAAQSRGGGVSRSRGVNA